VSDMPPELPGLEIPPPPPEPSLTRGFGSTAPRRARVAKPSQRTTATRDRTAASRRVGGDAMVWFVLQIIGLVGVIAAALVISASALIVVGGWQQTPDAIDPLTVAMIDLPMLVAFLCSVTFKWRGFSGWLAASRAFGIVMTAFSSAANFLYTVSASQATSGGTGLETYQEITGAIVHAAAPVLVNVCFEFFGQIITRPRRNATRLRKMTIKELRRVEKEIAARVKEADRFEKKAIVG
jgi:hypothetical protein